MNDVFAPPPAAPNKEGAEDVLASARAEIDGIDRQMLELVAQRLRAADRISGVKAQQPGLPIRPGREVQMLRALIAASPAPMEPELTVELWRALIAANLRRQRKIDVVVGGARNDPSRLFDVARRHFGARTRITHVGEPQAALLRAAEQPQSCVAVTTWPAAPSVGSWWPALTEGRFRTLHLIGALPIRAAGTEEPEAAVFAASPNEAGGEDVSLLIAFDPHHRSLRALAECGLSGKELARSEPRVLLRLEGFVGIDDPRAQALTNHGLDAVRVLGSYARV